MAHALGADATSTRSDLECRLRDLLTDVNGWLRFAEAKNGALAAAVLAGVFAIGQLEIRFTELGWVALAYLGPALVLATLSASISVASFMPQLRVPWLHATGSPSDADNLLYFGHIAKYKPTRFLDAFQQYVGFSVQPPTPLDRAYAEQIVTNARIAVRKFRSFEFAVWLALAGMITPILAVLLLVIEKRRQQEDHNR